MALLFPKAEPFTVTSSLGGAVSTSKTSIYAGLLALLLATSSIVIFEPAPYDILAIALFVTLVPLGLAFPKDVALPLTLLLCFLLGNLLAAMLAVSPLETLRSMAIRTYMVLTWLLIVSLLVVDGERMLKALWQGYLCAAVLAALWGVLEYFGMIPGELWPGGLRAHAGFKDPNVFGPFLVPAALYTLHRIMSPWAFRPAQIVMLGLFSLAILLSFSRGAWINYSVSLGLFSLFLFLEDRRLTTRLKWLAGGLFMAGGLVVLVLAATSFGVVADRLEQRFVFAQEYDLKPGGRFDTQRRVAEYIGGDPVGVGPGRTDEVFGLEPHNLYLHVFVEAGWLGGVSFVLFLILSVVWLGRARKRTGVFRRDAQIVWACLCGLLLQSFFIDSTHWRHFWLLLAMAWALIILSDRKDRTIN